jgi:hypothetical protein
LDNKIKWENISFNILEPYGCVVKMN